MNLNRPPGSPETRSLESGHFGLSWRKLFFEPDRCQNADGTKESAVVEPADSFKGRELHGSTDATVRSAARSRSRFTRMTSSVVVHRIGAAPAIACSEPDAGAPLFRSPLPHTTARSSRVPRRSIFTGRSRFSRTSSWAASSLQFVGSFQQFRSARSPCHDDVASTNCSLARTNGRPALDRVRTQGLDVLDQRALHRGPQSK